MLNPATNDCCCKYPAQSEYKKRSADSPQSTDRRAGNGLGYRPRVIIVVMVYGLFYVIITVNGGKPAKILSEMQMPVEFENVMTPMPFKINFLLRAG